MENFIFLCSDIYNDWRILRLQIDYCPIIAFFPMKWKVFLTLFNLGLIEVPKSEGLHCIL